MKLDNLPELSKLPIGELISTKISINGQFEFSVPVEGNETGWIWLLNGPIVFIGIQKDGAQVEDSLCHTVARRSILLPPPSLDDTDEDEAVASDITIGGVDPGLCSNHDRHSMDVSEDEMLSNPDIFNDTPGAFCRPFSNPNRVVSERSFHTILRVEQPTVGSKPYVPPYIPPRVATPMPGVIAATGSTTAPMTTTTSSGTGISMMMPIYTLGTATTTAASAAPATGIEVMHLNEEYKSQLKEFARKVPRGRFNLNANTPLNWEGNSTEYQATSLAFGHVLESRVQWRNNGYSLGKVAHSLTLAPRQTKRIVTIQSGIADKIRRKEATDFSESVDTGTDREYSYQNQVESHLKEWSKGGSIAGQMGGALGFAGMFYGVLVGGGGAHGLGASGSKQKGGRDLDSLS